MAIRFTNWIRDVIPQLLGSAVAAGDKIHVFDASADASKWLDPDEIADIPGVAAAIDVPVAGLAAHLADTTNAHAASAISITDTGAYFTGTDVEAALQEVGAIAASGYTAENARDDVGAALTEGEAIDITLNDGANTITIACEDASDTNKGVVELATSAEVATGTDTARAVTPAGAAAVYTPITQPHNAQTGTSYTLVLGDAGKLVTLSNASGITLTVPPNSSVAFPTGTRIDLAQLGAGQVTVAQGSGVTINKPSTLGLKLIGQYSEATLTKYATDTWLLAGHITA